MQLVNGATVRQDTGRFAVTYYHVELATHEVILAENLPAETYRDNGNRDRFAGGLGEPGGPMDSCFPLVLDGPELRPVRTLLHRRAIGLGHQIVHEVECHAVIETSAGPLRVAPRRRADRLIFDLPEAAAMVKLCSRVGTPADTDPASRDRRLLGICAGNLRADGRRLPVWHGAGWHSPAPHDRGLWTSREAELRLPRATRRISVDLLGSVPSWCRDPAELAI